MAGTIVADTWLNGDSTENFKCRAWAHVTQTGTQVLRASGNISSITDGGTGITTFTFINAMPDVYYSVVVGGRVTTSWVNSGTMANIISTTQVSVYHQENGVLDTDELCIAVFR